MTPTRWFVLVLLMLTASPFTTPRALDAQSDPFNAPTLASYWFWVREDPLRWSLTSQPGSLRIDTQFGDIAGTLYANARNILLQGTVAGDWMIETRVNVNPFANYQQGGLIAYDNDDNYVKIVRGYVSTNGGDVVEMISEVGGAMTFFQLRVPAKDVYLRLEKTGNDYRGQYSTTGLANQWFTVGNASNALADPKVGLVALTGPIANQPPVAVYFDYFDATGPGIGAFRPVLSDDAKLGTRVFVDITAEPNAFYRIAASLGDTPGLKLGMRTIPLNVDPLFLATLSDALPTIFRRFSGYLNQRGEARAWIDVPSAAELVGLKFWIAYVTLDANEPFGVKTISIATEVEVKT